MDSERSKERIQTLKIMFEKFSHTAHPKIGEIIFTLHYRTDATVTTYTLLFENNLVHSGSLDHGILDEGETGRQQLIDMITETCANSHGYKRFFCHLYDKLSTIYVAEELEKKQVAKQIAHRQRIISKRSLSVNPSFEILDRQLFRPRKCYGTDYGAVGKILLKKGTSVLVAGNGLTFYGNLPLPELPVKQFTQPVRLHVGRWNRDTLIDLIEQLRDLFQEPDLRVTDVVRGVTVVIPVDVLKAA